MASEENTTIEVSGRDNMMLDAGETQLLTAGSDQYVSVRADKPILLTQVRS